MKIYQSWKRNMPDSTSGESIVVTTLYTSFSKGEIDELEKKMPRGIIVMDTDEPRRMYPLNDIKRKE